MTARVLGIRPAVNPLQPMIEKVVGEALAMLDQQAAEARANGDTIHQRLMESQAAFIRAQKAQCDGVTSAVADAGAISDDQFKILRGDFKRSIATTVSDWRDQTAVAMKIRALLMAAAMAVALLVAGGAAVLYAWPGTPPGALTCSDFSDGNRWCQMAPKRGE